MSTIELAASGELIGCGGVRRAIDVAPTADSGYELNPDFWGQEYATESDALPDRLRLRRDRSV